jgi:2-alkyl-3-oxoalkanoate reductase
VSPRRLRAAFVGCGQIANIHALHLKNFSGTDLVAVCDVDYDRAEAFAHRHGIPIACAGIEEILDLRPDVVHVLTPPASHASVASACLDAGCHVYVEKPLATTAEGLQRLADAAKVSTATLCPGHNRLFDPPIAHAAGVLTEHGARALAVEIRLATVSPGPSQPRHNDIAAHWEDVGIHGAYLLRAFLGDIEDWCDMAYVAESDAPGLAALGIGVRCARGLGSILLTIGTEPPRNTVFFRAERLSITADLNAQSVVLWKPWGLPKPLERAAWGLSEGWQLWGSVFKNGTQILRPSRLQYPGMRTLIRRFHAGIAAGSPPPVELDDAFRVTGWYIQVLSALRSRVH